MVENMANIVQAKCCEWQVYFYANLLVDSYM